jgi:hypothetical protein
MGSHITPGGEHTPEQQVPPFMHGLPELHSGGGATQSAVFMTQKPLQHFSPWPHTELVVAGSAPHAFGGVVVGVDGSDGMPGSDPVEGGVPPGWTHSTLSPTQ